MGDIAQLIGQDEGVADLRFDIAVRVAIDPVVYAAVGDIVAQLHGESAVDGTADKLRGGAKFRRHMVGEHNLRLGLAFSDSLLDELQAPLVLAVEIVRRKQVFAVHDTIKVGHGTLCVVGVLRVDMRPKCGGNDIHIADVFHGVGAYPDVRKQFHLE